MVLIVDIVFAWVLLVVGLNPSLCSTTSRWFGLARHVSGSRRGRRLRLGISSWGLIRRCMARCVGRLDSPHHRCHEGAGLTLISTVVEGS